MKGVLQQGAFGALKFHLSLHNIGIVPKTSNQRNYLTLFPTGNSLPFIQYEIVSYFADTFKVTGLPTLSC